MQQQECSCISQNHTKALWCGNPQSAGCEGFWQEKATWALLSH